MPEMISALEGYLDDLVNGHLCICNVLGPGYNRARPDTGLVASSRRILGSATEISLVMVLVQSNFDMDLLVRVPE